MRNSTVKNADTLHGQCRTLVMRDTPPPSLPAPSDPLAMRTCVGRYHVVEVLEKCTSVDAVGVAVCIAEPLRAAAANQKSAQGFTGGARRLAREDHVGTVFAWVDAGHSAWPVDVAEVVEPTEESRFRLTLGASSPPGVRHAGRHWLRPARDNHAQDGGWQLYGGARAGGPSGVADLVSAAERVARAVAGGRCGRLR